MPDISRTRKPTRRPRPQIVLEPPEQDDDQPNLDLDEAIVVWLDYKKRAEELSDMAEKAKTPVAETMIANRGPKRNGPKSHTTLLPDGRRATVTVVESDGKIVTDEKKLKARIGPVLWRKITTPVVDKAKLDACIKSGEIEVADLAACSATIPVNPFIKASIK
jgi:hypothetical protein